MRHGKISSKSIKAAKSVWPQNFFNPVKHGRGIGETTNLAWTVVFARFSSEFRVFGALFTENIKDPFCGMDSHAKNTPKPQIKFRAKIFSIVSTGAAGSEKQAKKRSFLRVVFDVIFGWFCPFGTSDSRRSEVWSAWMNSPDAFTSFPQNEFAINFFSVARSVVNFRKNGQTTSQRRHSAFWPVSTFIPVVWATFTKNPKLTLCGIDSQCEN